MTKEYDYSGRLYLDLLTGTKPLSFTAKKLYILYSSWRASKIITFGHAYAAPFLGLKAPEVNKDGTKERGSSNKISKAIRELEAKGLVSVSRKRDKTNTVKLIPVEDIKRYFGLVPIHSLKKHNTTSLDLYIVLASQYKFCNRIDIDKVCILAGFKNKSGKISTRTYRNALKKLEAEKLIKITTEFGIDYYELLDSKIKTRQKKYMGKVA